MDNISDNNDSHRPKGVGRQTGRRFVFGIVAIICVSVVTVKLGYIGEVYLKLVGSIVGLYMATQSWTDSQRIKKEKE